MQKMGWFVLVTLVTLGLVGYHRQPEALTFSTPQGYAAPLPIPKTSWKDSLSEINPYLNNEKPDEKVLILEMAKDSPVPSPLLKEVKKPEPLKPAKIRTRKVLKTVRTAKLLRKRSRIH